MATQDFTATDGTQVQNLTGWDQCISNLEVNTNRCYTADTGGGFTGAVYTGADLTADHSSELVTTIFGSGFRSIGPTVRAAVSTGLCYFIRSRGDYNPTDLCEIAADGTVATLDTGTLRTGTHTYKLTAVGTQLNMYVDGALDSNIANPVTDGTISTGNPGVGGVGTLNTSSNYGDTWEGLQIGGGGGMSSRPPIMTAFFRGGP